MDLFFAEMIQNVDELLSSHNAFPIAITISPTSIDSCFSVKTTGLSFLSQISACSMAISVMGSVAIKVAGISYPVCVIITYDAFVLAMTCLLVRISPSGDITTPVPPHSCCFMTLFWWKKPNGSSRNISTSCATTMLTTDGDTFCIALFIAC